VGYSVGSLEAEIDEACLVGMSRSDISSVHSIRNGYP
jgi:hypothetical protein